MRIINITFVNIRNVNFLISRKREVNVPKIKFFFVKENNSLTVKENNSLAVFHPPHIYCTFTECLTFHIDTIFTNKSITTFTSCHTTRTGTLSVSLRMSGVQFIWFPCFSHFKIVYGMEELLSETKV